MANNDAEKQAQQAALEQEFPPITVKRNDVDLLFRPTKKSRGTGEGDVFYAPDPDFFAKVENLPAIQQWIGGEVILATLGQRVRAKAQGWHKEATEDDNSFSQEKFVEYASSFSARGESIPELKAEIDEKMEAMMTAVDSENLEAARKLRDEIKSLKLAIDQKRRKTKEEEAEAATVAG